MPRLYNKHHGDVRGAVYIGRPSPWGNPFSIGKDGTREEVIEKYREWVLQRELFVEQIKEELQGCDLICWCYPKSCHGEVLLEIANGK